MDNPSTPYSFAKSSLNIVFKTVIFTFFIKNTHLNKRVATEIFINNDQSIFEKLFEHKADIEEQLGYLEWQPIEGKKSSRIRKTLGVDILKEENIERAVKLQIQTAEDFKKVFSKYLV